MDDDPEEIPPSEVILYGYSSSLCGYCQAHSRQGRVSYGLDAKRLTTRDYQALIDRGWRRSGTFIYLPDNRRSCCPNWTIRMSVPDFKISKKLKQAQNKFRNYVNYGPKESEELLVGVPGSSELAYTEMQSYLKSAVKEALHRQVPRDNLTSFDMKIGKGQFICNAALILSSMRRHQNSDDVSDPKLVGIQLADELRRLILIDYESQEEISVTSDDKGFLHFRSSRIESMSAPKKKTKLRPPDSGYGPENPYIRFTTDLIPARFSEEAFSVYREYQVAVHKDPIDRATKDQYKHFLCDTPLSRETSPDPSIQYGSFHIEYRLDGRLMGVSVIDILPKCVSAVYFFYHPDYSFLSPGFLSALHEISLVPNSLLLPNLKFYYLGYYVHGCPKMHYKKEFAPSQLMCSERLTWHPMEQCLPALDQAQYVVFSDICPPITGQEEPEPECDGAIEEVRFFLPDRGMVFFGDLQLTPRERLEACVQAYFQKVGPWLATERLAITHILSI